MEAGEGAVRVAADAAVAKVHGERECRCWDRDDEVHRLAVALGCETLTYTRQLVREVKIGCHFVGGAELEGGGRYEGWVKGENLIYFGICVIKQPGPQTLTTKSVTLS
jgi:hypothetical protein